MKEIYLDHAATTPMDEQVLNEMYSFYREVYGNPSSVHSFGRKARRYLDEARASIASSIHAKEKEIIFTSGGTEADNLALIGTALANQHKGKHIITTVQEHHAVLHTAEYLERIGFEVTYLPVNENGKVSVADLKVALQRDTILVSVMYVNNETGVEQPVQEMATLLKDHQAYFHTDAVQAYGLISIDVDELGVDLLSISAHKMNGPKGTGFLYVNESVQINQTQFGGEQERKRRAGTENVIPILGMEKAVQLALKNNQEKRTHLMNVKHVFLQELESHGIHFLINGDRKAIVPSIINISFVGTDVEALLTNFDLAGIAASSGSACTAGSIEPSHVLTAMYGKGHERTRNSVRFSFGSNHTEEDSQIAAERISKIIKRLTK